MATLPVPGEGHLSSRFPGDEFQRGLARWNRRRLAPGLPGDDCLHAVLDVKHSEAWNREAIAPSVAEDPRRAGAIAEGALIRLRCGERCFARYRAGLWQRR
jgi:hypothetical protein